VRRIVVLVGTLLLIATGAAAEDPLAKETRAALEKATASFRSLSTQGGYLWWYSEDLKERAGERKATETQIWVQPPGTPSVGMAFLRAYEVTKDRQYLDAARSAADALARGQLESGGWDYVIDFDPQESKRWYRRSDRGMIDAKEAAKRRNTSTFDDNNTQSALRLLMAAADASKGSAGEQDARIREALEYGLAGMLRAQYPNGAWPQRYDGKPRNPGDYPARRARFPETWSRTWPGSDYQGFYTFNDNSIRDCILTMLEAHRRYGKREYLEAAKKAGDFILLAQLPAPQAAWAQQYDREMQPAWARKFEPPSVSSGESGGIVRTLIDLYLETGEAKYLDPVPAAIDWFKRSQIAPNKWARFYEMGTNKPLYFTKDYKLVYTDDDLPTHYSFQASYGLPAVIAYYEEVKRLGREAYLEQRKPRPLTPVQREARRRSLESRTREVIQALDPKGRWVANGRIESQVFIRNAGALSDYLEVAEAAR
jgi:pectate lyase-like protein